MKCFLTMRTVGKGTRRSSFAGNREALTFTLSGVSKISALPQMKLAWVATSGPEEIVTEAGARLEIIADTFLSMSAPVQLAAPVLLEQRRDIQTKLLDRVRTNLAELDRQLADHPSCTRLLVEGGWYVVLRVPVLGLMRSLRFDFCTMQALVFIPDTFTIFRMKGILCLVSSGSGHLS